VSPTKPLRHILRSSSNTATAAGGGGSGGSQDSRLPPSGRGLVHTVTSKTSGAPQSPEPVPEQNAFSGLISRAKEGLSTSSSRTFHKSDTQQHQQPAPRVPEKSETQIQWEEVEKNMTRALKVPFYSLIIINPEMFTNSSHKFIRWRSLLITAL